MCGDGVPEALEAAARRLDADADAARRGGDVLARSAAALRWSGGAAESFLRAAAADRARLHRAAAELDEAAAALHVHARRVRARLERLRALERAAAERPGASGRRPGGRPGARPGGAPPRSTRPWTTVHTVTNGG